MRRLFLLAFLVAGCDSPEPPAPIASPSLPSDLPPWTGPTGTVAGCVLWPGPRPQPVTIETFRPAVGGRAERVVRPAPNIPTVSADGGVVGALVYLDGVSHSACLWPYPPATLELHDERPMVRQGDGPPRHIGFVHRGDAITIVSKQDRFHAARARGAAFWTFTLPDADRPVVRRLDQPGIVELCSAAGYYWMHDYLFVSDHPYCGVTDESGRFQFDHVPPGEYQLVAWLPSWTVIRRERDPESTAVVRIVFGPHHEWRQKVTVHDKVPVSIEVVVSPQRKQGS